MSASLTASAFTDAFAPSPLRTAFRVKRPTGTFHHSSLARLAPLRATLLERIESSIVTPSNATDSFFPDNSEYQSPLVGYEKKVGTPETTVDKNQLLEFAGLGTWIAGLSTFLLVNNFVGPWPEAAIKSVPVEFFGLAHALGGMLFAGGIVLTTLVEWLVVSSKDASILKFWFKNVPGLDSFIVLPALTASIVSGVGLAVDHYDSLGQSPVHVVAAISTLLAFAVWWALTDLTTQGAADKAVEQWHDEDDSSTDVPKIVELRKISNVISCMFVVALYAIMVLKPGYIA